VHPGKLEREGGKSIDAEYSGGNVKRNWYRD